MAADIGVDLAAGPPPGARFRRRLRPWRRVREVWGARMLVVTLAEREIRIRYKQAVLGFAWAVLTPLVLMIAFTLFFRKAAVEISFEGQKFLVVPQAAILVLIRDELPI